MDPNSIPNTASYLYLGLAAVAAITGLFLASLVIRFASLRRELKTIEQAENEL